MLYQNQRFILELKKLNLLPFIEILKILLEKGVNEFNTIISSIENGNFSNQNKIHIQIEYSRAIIKEFKGLSFSFLLRSLMVSPKAVTSVL